MTRGSPSMTTTVSSDCVIGLKYGYSPAAWISRARVKDLHLSNSAMCCRVSVRTKARIPVGRSVQLSRGCRKSQGGAGPRVSATVPRAISWAPVHARATAPVAALAAVAIRLAAQAPAYRYGWGDAATTAGAVAVALPPSALRLPSLPPPCAPCDPAALWSIDRRVLGGAALGSAVGWLVARFHP